MSRRLTPERVVIRAMTLADVTTVMAIERVAYPFPWSTGIFQDCIKVGHQCRVASVDAAVRGYLVSMAAAGEGHVLNLCVDPQWQGLGLGRRLMEAMTEDAAENGVQSVFLEVRPSNVAAIALYTSLGFNEIARRPGYYPAHEGREDAVVMALDLACFSQIVPL